MTAARPTPSCPACGAANGCALAAGTAPESCWCRRVEWRAPLPRDRRAACYCPTCLARLAAARSPA